MSSNDFRISTRLKSFKYAWNGIKLSFKEHNMRIHLAIAIITAVLGVVVNLNATEWALITMTIGVMFSAEAFNTAIEHLADAVQPEFDLQIGKVKDITAGAVLFMAIASIIIGLIIFVPNIIELLS